MIYLTIYLFYFQNDVSIDFINVAEEKFDFNSVRKNNSLNEYF